jgi:hypothetical protein
MSGQHQKRPLYWLLLAGLIAFAVSMPLPFMPFSGTAIAQEVRERRSFLDVIFGTSRPRTTRSRPSIVRVKRRKPSSAVTSSDPAAPEPEAEVAKAPDAKKILVIGDFMASALSDGLAMATEGDATIVIEKSTDGSSGLVRTDHLDWPKTLRQQIGDIRPALIVIMLGSNDRQAMTVDGVKQKFSSDAWNTEYDRRVTTLIKIANDSKIPFIWTGLPSFQSPSLSADAATLNNLYRAKTEAGGGVFIDTWDGFADEDGKFIASGSDMNGQPVRLRGPDGLSLTKAGKRKMAFYLEKDMRRLTGTDDIANLIRMDSILPTLDTNAAAPPSVMRVLTVPPVSLADPELDGAKQLLDTGLMPKTSGQSPRDLLIEKGETEAAPGGRIDDFSWKPVTKPAG